MEDPRRPAPPTALLVPVPAAVAEGAAPLGDLLALVSEGEVVVVAVCCFSSVECGGEGGGRVRGILTQDETQHDYLLLKLIKYVRIYYSNHAALLTIRQRGEPPHNEARIPNVGHSERAFADGSNDGGGARKLRVDGGVCEISRGRTFVLENN